MKRIVLDTNAYSALMAGTSEAVFEAISSAERVYFPAVVLGELFGGFRAGSREQANRKQLSQFMRTPPVRILHTTEETADHYAAIFVQLRTAGNRIPANDMWIAAHTMEQGAWLASSDKHFASVPGLRWWNPMPD